MKRQFILTYIAFYSAVFCLKSHSVLASEKPLLSDNAVKRLQGLKYLTSESRLVPADLGELPDANCALPMPGREWLLVCEQTKATPQGTQSNLNIYQIDAKIQSLAFCGVIPKRHKELMAWGIHSPQENTFLLFPRIGDSVPSNDSPVYRWNRPYEWTTQPYDSLNRSFLRDVLFAKCDFQNGVFLRIYNGLNETKLSKPLTLPPGMDKELTSLTCVGLKVHDDNFCGCLGLPEDGTGWSRLFYFEGRFSESANRKPLQVLPVGQRLNDADPEPKPSFYSPSLALTPKGGRLFFWRIAPDKTPLTLAGAEGMQLYECMMFTPTLGEQSIVGYVMSQSDNGRFVSSSLNQWKATRDSYKNRNLPKPLLACAEDGEELMLNIGWKLMKLNLVSTLAPPR